MLRPVFRIAMLPGTMGHCHRFYTETPVEPGEVLTLSPEESHHALHVVRLREGDEIALFDGQGWGGEATVVQLDRRRVRVRVDHVLRADPPRWRLTVYQAAITREKKAEYLIQRGTELGVSRFCFFRGGHSGRDPKISPKWPRVAIEACKQCGRLWLPEFTCADSLAQAIEGAKGPLLVAAMDLPPTPLREALAPLRSEEGGDVGIIVGPEGDFDPDELALLQQRGVTPFSLGPSTFRAEVAAALSCALALYELGALGPLPDA